MKLSLVTGTYNRPKQYRRLLDSILRHTSVDYEIVVSDASDSPEIFPHERVKTIIEQPRLGHCKGYNAAFRACTGDYILWLNDDAEVTENYDVEAVSFMESNKKIGLGALHYSENGSPFHINSAWGVPYANFGIFPRWLGEKVGYFDEAISMYGADNSLAFRILLADYGIAEIAKSRILHHSEQDAVRRENQVNRLRDNRVLQEVYMPKRKYWLAAYQRYRMPETAVWTHGQPNVVLA